MQNYQSKVKAKSSLTSSTINICLIPPLFFNNDIATSFVIYLYHIFFPIQTPIFLNIQKNEFAIQIYHVKHRGNCH